MQMRTGTRDCWLPWHIDAALAIIFGRAQFKEGTDLWSTKRVGMLPAPDFGRQLSHDRFQRVLSYWARGLPEERQKLKENPWAQIDPLLFSYPCFTLHCITFYGTFLET